jgi:hypothetical protein
MSYQAFWTWLAGESAAIRSAFAAAATAKDYPALERLVNRIGEHVQAIDPRIAIRLNGGSDGALKLAITSADPAAIPIARAVLAAAPAIAGWTFVDAIDVPAQNIIVRTADGDELVVAYRDVRFRLLPPKPDGSVSVIFTIDAEFDPKSPRGALYQAAATEILKHAFGGPPPRMGTYAFVPASWVEPPTRPVSELASAWADQLAIGK